MPSPNRRPCLVAGSTLYLLRHSSALLDDAVGPSRFGKVLSEVGLESAAMVAEFVALKMLATIQVAWGCLDRVEQVLKITGCINSDSGFETPNSVLNGASDPFYRVYGPDAGQGEQSRCILPVSQSGLSTVVGILLPI